MPKSAGRDIWLSQKKGIVAESSFARYRAVLDNFSYYLEHVCRMGNPSVAEITHSIASSYINHRRTTPLMPNGSRKFTRTPKSGAAKKTLHFEKEQLKQVFRAAIRLELIEANPFDEVRADKPSSKEVRAKHHWLSRDEATALLKAAALVDDSSETGNANFADIIEFLLKTGERLDEMVHLEWRDVDWANGVIHVEEKTGAKAITEVRTVPIPPQAIPLIKSLISDRAPDERLFATDEERVRSGLCLDIKEKAALMDIKVGEVDLEKAAIVASRTFEWTPKGSDGEVPMCGDIQRLLQRLQQTSKSNFVFAHHDGGVCRLRLLDMLKEAVKRAGIKGNVRVHDLRHTCAVRLRDNGVPLQTIMGILRHANIRETLIYAPYKDEEGQKAILCLDS